MDFMQLLDELKTMGAEGEQRWYCRFPLFGKTVLDADEFFQLVNELATSLPQEVTTASQVSAEKAQILEEAHRERQKILDSAREQAQLLISNDSLVLEAQARAKEIIRQAKVEGDGIRAEAEQWARGIVERLDNYMGRIAATVDKTKKALQTQPQPTVAPRAGNSPGRGGSQGG